MLKSASTPIANDSFAAPNSGGRQTAVDRDGMDIALPSGMKGEAPKQGALQDRTASMRQCGVSTPPRPVADVGDFLIE